MEERSKFPSYLQKFLKVKKVQEQQNWVIRNYELIGRTDVNKKGNFERCYGTLLKSESVLYLTTCNFKNTFDMARKSFHFDI